MKKRILIIGASQAGKSTFANYLDNAHRELKKKQDVIYGKYSIDVPASYLENARFYCHIFALVQVASSVVILIDSKNPTSNLPPEFAKSFNCPVIGLLTKEGNHSSMDRAKDILIKAGVTEISIFDKNNQELRRKLLNTLVDEGGGKQ